MLVKYHGCHSLCGPSQKTHVITHGAVKGMHARRRWCQVSAVTAEGVEIRVPVAPKPLYEGKNAVVVGAGPAGATTAMYLAQQGFKVDVYERRPLPAKDVVDTGRAYIIILIPRGQAALNELGVPLPLDGPFKTLGTVRHNFKGKVSISREEGNVTFSRSGLAQYLIGQATDRFPEQIRFHFDSECTGVDLAARQAFFTSPGSTIPNAAQYDLLVGADGVASAVRDLVRAQVPGFTVDISDSGREYKVYSSLRGDIEPPEFKGRQGATLHLFTADDPFTTVTAHSNPDGTYTGTFSLKSGGFEGLVTVAQYEELLATKFKGLPPGWPALIAAQVAAASPNSGGKRIRCSQLYAPGVVLLGDAAHAVTPVFGQGANSSLESCVVLSKVLVKAGGDVDLVPVAFDAARREDAHALFELDRMAYSFFRKKGLLDPDFVTLLSHVVLGTILSKIVPFWYGSKPALLQLGGSTPYSVIMTAVRRDSLAAAVTVAAILAFAVLKLARLL